MRKLILTSAAVAFVGLTGPAFADMTLPVGSYSQSSAWGSSDSSEPAFSALADQDQAYAASRHGTRVHHSLQR